ncbi:BFD domain protein (2Fe-2S)-binding domain protein [Thermanaerovibrio acidaminovorans DSM 6589]|uniref:BFD domain protein (2Fe-2S)-binding domain protein n=1 Tax=Thermanaerovibrio acidaminovorans (strain ATCC 49978 / DSM 6589 / Su883) TaxID=525903 RepID=D1B6X0_THEAS|nr:(2Fe-2S)-binding protein [Thermanaerovibrio acidaminovorans]ACZ19761.1 BFD domain protein (2Fe-2S)-binding domain protein [Thermanaerovibrio acidaminovorans DSM 6589]
MRCARSGCGCGCGGGGWTSGGSPCPRCGAEGSRVHSRTVESLVTSPVPPGDYWLCTSPDCPVVYHSGDVIFTVDQVRVPVDFKAGASPRYVCYCDRITREQVLEAIRNGAVTVDDVARMTGGMRGGRCGENNPKGRCCHGDVMALISSGG